MQNMYHWYIPRLYEVNYVIIPPGSRVLDFSGNSHAQKPNKAHKNQEKITDVPYFPGIWSCLRTHQHEWCQICLILYPLFIKIPQNLLQTPFSPPSSPPTEYDTFVPWTGLWFCTAMSTPTYNDANLTIITPPTNSNLSSWPPCFHRQNRCMQPDAYEKDLLPPPPTSAISCR